MDEEIDTDTDQELGSEEIIEENLERNSYLSDEEVEDIRKTIFDVCKNPETTYRSPCTKGEKKGAEYFQKQLLKLTDTVRWENFECRPEAFLGSIKLSGYFLIISISLYIFYPLLAPFVAIFALSCFPLEYFGLMRYVEQLPILNQFYKKARSQNVHGILKPIKETKRIYVFGGHVDSPNVFPITARFRRNIVLIVGVAFVISFLYIIGSIGRFIRVIELGTYNVFAPPFDLISNWNFLHWIALIGVIFSPYIFWITFGFTSKELTQGANDNLSGCACSLAVMRYFKKHPLNHIEIWTTIFGCEEAGQRGSTAFALTHYDELRNKDAYCLNYESCGSGEKITIATAEKNTGLLHHPDAYNSLFKASKKLKTEIPVRVEPMTDGFSDSEPFSRYKVAKSTTILGFDLDDVPHIWHMTSDIPENIEAKNVKQNVEMGIQWLLDADEELSQLNQRKK
jgi:hypothetical protein